MHAKLKTPMIIAGAIIIAGVSAGAAVTVAGAKKPNLNYLPVRRGDVSRQVRLSGSVRPAEAVDLAFERSGRLVRVAAAVGDKVPRGQALAFLDGSDLAAQESQAQAALEGAQARLADLKRGLRPEEADVLSVRVAGAEDALKQARVSAANTLAFVYTSADDAVRSKVDPLFSNPTYAVVKLNFFIPDFALRSRLEDGRMLMEGELVRWQSETAALAPDSDLEAAVVSAKAHLVSVNALLADASLAVDKIDLHSNPGLADATVAGYKSGLSAARSSLASAVSAVAGADQQLSAARTALMSAKSDQSLKLAGATPEAVAAQEAAVHQAEAALEAVRVQTSKTVLRSPIDGLVTREDGHVGQLVAPNSALVTVISDQQFEIKAEASETDVADIKVGSPAQVTLDAYGTGTVFDAEVSAVDPADTGASASPSYRVTLHFKSPDGRIKSGLTANATIAARTSTNVIAIPRQAVILRGDKQFVIVETPNGPQEKEVKLGLQGTDGQVEVVSGLDEEDRIADFGGRQ